MGKLYEKKYALNYFDFDKNYKLKPTTMMNFLQDISTIHFGFKTSHLPEETLNGIWVIVEWKVKLNEMPKEVMDLTIKTKPTYFRKFIAYRRYEMDDNSGKIIGTGISKWAYIDQITRKQIQIPKVLNEIFGVDENAIKPEKIIYEDMEGAVLSTLSRTSVYSDIDVNKHVNNVTYIKWAIDALESDFLDRYQLDTLTVSFKCEVFEGDRVVIETAVKETDTGAVSMHKIFSQKGVLCVVLQFEWN